MLVCKYKMDRGEVFFAPLMNICNVLSSARSNYISGWLFNKKEQILWPKWLVYIIHQQINFCCGNWCSFKNEWWMSVCPFTVILGGLQDHIKEILRCRRLILIACGTSFHAGVAVGISLWYTRLNYSFPSSLLEAMIKQKTSCTRWRSFAEVETTMVVLSILLVSALLFCWLRKFPAP